MRKIRLTITRNLARTVSRTVQSIVVFLRTVSTSSRARSRYALSGSRHDAHATTPTQGRRLVVLGTGPCPYPSNASASRDSNNPSMVRQAHHNACLSPSDIIPEGGILPRTKSPSEASGSDSTRATTLANSRKWLLFMGISKSKLLVITRFRQLP